MADSLPMLKITTSDLSMEESFKIVGNRAYFILDKIIENTFEENQVEIRDRTDLVFSKGFSLSGKSIAFPTGCPIASMPVYLDMKLNPGEAAISATNHPMWVTLLNISGKINDGTIMAFWTPASQLRYFVQVALKVDINVASS